MNQLGKLLELKRELTKIAGYKINNIFLNFSSTNTVLIWGWGREEMKSYNNHSYKIIGYILKNCTKTLSGRNYKIFLCNIQDDSF